MTTATAVAGRPLSGWSRDARFGTWHALLPDGSGGPVRGALRIDPALLGPQGTRERLAAAVLATAKLRLPGLLGTVDLVAEADAVWLLTARPPAPTLADILSADGPRPDAGSAASILNETAQTLLALHTAGLTHGSLAPDTVVLAVDGVALLAETGLSAVLGDAPAAAVRLPGDLPHPDRRAADTAAWAALARTLGAAWTQAGTPAADLFAHCATTAESEGLPAARAALVAGHAALPANFLRRTALRTAAAAATPPFAPRTTPPPAGAASAPVGPPAPDHAPRTPHPLSAPADAASAPVGPPAPDHAPRTPHPRPAPADGASAPQGPPAPDHAPRTPHPRPAPADGASAPQGPPAPDHESRTGGAGGNPYPAEGRVWVPHNAPAPAPAPGKTPPDTQATVLGKRHRVTSPPAPPGENSGEILLRFGPGIPADEQHALRARWRTEAPVPTPQPPRRRRRGWLISTAVVAIAAVLLWLLMRPTPTPAVVAVQVQAPAGTLHCGQTADLVGVVTTDGQAGPVTYRWLRGDGQDSGELVRTAHKGERRLRVHLRWTVRGPGRFRGTARLRIAHQRAPLEAKAGFTYVCP
ncbi:hypothetical protein [Streptomyces sp. Ag109_G2-15]|uniref:hypothetical protein n=1 Tax=Streptomyces sp. Ag109_G2-15 TaxID=1938850 RepID=UPI000BDD8657|nr:hypothetical protein [Streptomyces sp. Ag109_G2-15]SOE08096.1 hypothetical protein SAMN06272765_9024 [Streptomyces sp. Ag109_G2-15]